MKFIQITDTHIVPPGDRLHHLVPSERLEACVESVNEYHSDAEFCVLTGDLVDKGDDEGYRELRRILSKLKVPFHPMIGNHDCRETFLFSFPEVEADESGFVQYVVPTAVGDFFLLDSVEPGTDIGHLCGRRLAWLEDRLKEASDRAVYLFMHHPPFDIGLKGLDRIRLREPDRLASLIGRFPNVRHLFFGHVHRPISGSWRGIPFSALRGTNHQVALDFKEEKRIIKSHEPPAYAVALLEHGQTVVHVHDYLDNSVI
jgi:3',5'-cyclic AMP phosphodiesterase CpdA